MATTKEKSEKWAQIDESDDQEPTTSAATQQTNKTEEGQESAPREHGPKKTYEKKQEIFPQKNELITSIKEMEDNYVQLMICKANYNADVPQVIQAFKSRELRHGFIKKIKDGLFAVDFESHDQAINFIKVTPKIMDRPYFVKLGRNNQDHTGWKVEGAVRPNNQKNSQNDYYSNNKPPKKTYNNQKRYQKFSHPTDEEHHAVEGGAQPVEKEGGYSRPVKNRYDNSQINRSTVRTEEQKDDSAPTNIERPQPTGASGEDAPPGMNLIQHKKRDPNYVQKPYNNPQGHHHTKTQDHSAVEDPNKPKQQYRPFGFSKGPGHKQSGDHQDSKHSDPFGGAKGIVPKEIITQVKKLQKDNITKDLKLPEYNQPPTKTTQFTHTETQPVVAAPSATTNLNASSSTTTTTTNTSNNNTQSSQQNNTSAPVQVRSEPAPQSTTSASTGKSTGTQSSNNNNNNRRQEESKVDQKVSSSSSSQNTYYAPPAPAQEKAVEDEWIVSGSDQNKPKNKNQNKK